VRAITATTPDGVAWTVRVIWQPRWRPLARRFGGWRRRRKGVDLSGPLDGVDVPTGGGGSGGGGVFDSLFDDLAIAILVIIGLVVAGALFWWLILPLLLLAVDILVVVVLFALAIPARVLFRRPWTVEAVTKSGSDADRFVTDVVGWRPALRTRDDIVDKIKLGYPTPVLPELRRMA
jgi:hypothetical protein